ncbi:MAG: tandem-95 repeat protein [Halanaerobiales bacterium]|nr:tandem-95 repeat protein [Halanaerobiales bacterium]
MGKKSFLISSVFLIGLALLLSGCIIGTYTISGKVTDESGNPIEGVKIVTSGGSTEITSTNTKGNWTILKAKGTTTITPKKEGWGFKKTSEKVTQAATNINFTGSMVGVITVTTSGQGSVLVYPEENTFPIGTKITLTPAPAAGWSFSHWEGDVADHDDPKVVIVDSNKEITAVFLQEPKVIIFADANLEEAVRVALNKPYGAITTADVRSLTTLDASISKIGSLDGIEFLTTLTNLNLTLTDISDIHQLANLIKLEILNLSFNKINKINALILLPNIKVLDLSKNYLVNLDDMVYLTDTNLTELRLGANEISDISPIKDITTLEILSLNENQLTNVDDLEKLMALKELDLSGNQIGDIDVLFYLRNLEKLNMANDYMTDLSGLEWLWEESLLELNLSNNQIDDLHYLTGMITLEKLDLSKNNFVSIEDLAELTMLTELDLSGNLIENIDALAKLTNLEKLHLHDNQLTDISVLLNLVNLKEITLMRNEPLDVAPNTPNWEVLRELRGRGVVTMYDFYKNDPPHIYSPGDKVVNEDEELSFVLRASDPDGDMLYYSAEGDFAEQFDPDTHTFTWTPTYDHAGVYSITFEVSDGQVVETDTITITVNNVNRPPVLEHIGTVTTNETQNLNFEVLGSDPDGDALIYTAEGDFAEQFDQSSRTFNWTPTYDDSGNYSLTIIVTDGDLSVSENVTIEVKNVNRTPVMDYVGNKTLNETEQLTFSITASDPDGDNLIFTAQGQEIDRFDSETQVFDWQTGYFDAGVYSITFVADDGDLTATESIIITVNNVDRPPVLEVVGDKVVDEYSLLTFRLRATDEDGEEITYSGFNMPTAGELNSETGEFNWIPNIDDIGERVVSFKALANGYYSVPETITITINNVEFAPELAIGGQEVDEDQLLEFMVPAIDRDRDHLIYTVEGDLTEHYNPDTFTFSWTPTYDDAGAYTMIFTADDGMFQTSETISIIVNHVNRPPGFTTPVGNKSVNETEILQFTVEANDPDGDMITYEAQGDLARYFNKDTQVFYWETTYDDAGDYSMSFVVEDEPGLQVDDTILIHIENVDRLPVITEINKLAIDPDDDPENALPIIVDEYNRIFFEIIALDEDGDLISYSIDTEPAEAQFNTTAGQFDWTPTADHLGEHEFIVSANANGNSDRKKIHITVNDVPHDPEFVDVEEWEEWTINEGETVDFVVKTRDLDKEALTLEAYGELKPYFDEFTSIFSYTSTFDSVKRIDGLSRTFTATFYLNDDDGDGANTVTQNIRVTVLNVDRKPDLDPIGDREVLVGVPFDFSIKATDDDGDPIVYNIINIPEGASFINATGYFSWTPELADIGEHSVQFMAEANGAVATETVLIKVVGPRLAIASLDFESLVEKGSSEIANVQVVNTGNVPASTFTISWEIIGKDNQELIFSPGTDDVPQLPIGSTTSKQREISTSNIPILGNYILRVKADSDGGQGGPVSRDIEFTVVNPTYTLDVLFETGEGFVERDPDLSKYELGTDVTITATPEDGWIFTDWIGEIPGGTGGINPNSFTMNSNKTITANFDKVNLVSDLVFISERYKLTGEIVILSSVTNHVNRITDNNLIEINPQWSPDGEKILFEGIDEYGNHDIYYAYANTVNNEVIRVTFSETKEISPRWSQDGSKILFLSNKNKSDRFDLMAINFGKTDLEGPVFTFVSGNILKSISNPIVSADGNKIAFEALNQIWIIDFGGGIEENVTSIDANINNPANAQWSPGIGTPKIVFDSDGELYAVEFDGVDDIYQTFDLVKVTSNVYNDYKPVWSPDGTQVAFLSDRDGEAEIYIVQDDGTLYDAEGDGVLRATSIDGGEVIDLSWTADGWIVFTVEHNGKQDIYMVDDNGYNLTRLTYNSADDHTPSWK